MDRYVTRSARDLSQEVFDEYASRSASMFPKRPRPWLSWNSEKKQHIAGLLRDGGYASVRLMLDAKNLPPVNTIKGWMKANGGVKTVGRPTLLTKAEEQVVLDSFTRIRQVGAVVDLDGLATIAGATTCRTRAGDGTSFEVARTWSRSFARRHHIPLRKITSSRAPSTMQDIIQDNEWRRDYELLVADPARFVGGLVTVFLLFSFSSDLAFPCHRHHLSHHHCKFAWMKLQCNIQHKATISYKCHQGCPEDLKSGGLKQSKYG